MRLSRICPTGLKSAKIVAVGGAMALAMALGAGCETKSFLDPSEVGRYRKGEALTVKILDQLDPGRESIEPMFANAQDVRASDLEVNASDYVIGPNDLITVSITDLQGQGIETVRSIRVTESGFINLPLIGQIKAEGMTEAQLQQAIGQAYSQAGIFAAGQEPQVTVTVAEARARTFRILGAVSRPNTYIIIEADYRLLDALVDAGDVTAPTGVDYLYVIRERRAEQSSDEGGAGGAGGAAPTRPTGRDPLAPRSQLTQPAQPGPNDTRIALMQASDAPSANTAAAAGASRPAGETEGRYVLIDGRPVLVTNQDEAAAPAPRERATRAAAAPHRPVVAQAQPPARGQNPQPGARRGGGFEFNAPREPEDVRVIRVPINQLKRGELKYNIVVRPGDLIVVPNPVVGVYYMGGHVNAPGPYSLTAQRITLKNAIVGARGLDELAIPSRTDVIRRIGPNEEIFVRVDLEKIFAGQQSDLFLKPDDQVMVGTNAVAPFLAAFRNAFRVTYGFGFLYDRNFADDENDFIR